MKNTNLKNTTIFIFLLTLALSLNACYFKNIKGNGHVATEERAVSDFSKIQVSSGITVIFTQDPNYSVKVTSDDNLVKYITTEVHGTELRIGIKNGKSFRNVTKLEVSVSAPSLDKIDLSGASTFTSTNSLTSSKLDLMLSGASVINCNGTFDGITGDISGASRVVLEGTTGSCNFEASGASNYQTPGLTTTTAIVNLSGASNCTLTIVDVLIANLSGASVVNYYGNPSVTSDLSGSSSINKK